MIPPGRSSPSGPAISASTGWPLIPAQGRVNSTAPSRACAMNAAIKLAGIAKPIPFDPPERVKIEVLIPINRPSTSINAPPELPGLIGASVWMKYPCPPPFIPPDRASPETIPLLTVCPTPKGLPMASVNSPTSTVSLSRNDKGVSPSTSSIFRIARSLSASLSSTRAENSRRSDRTIRMSVDIPTT